MRRPLIWLLYLLLAVMGAAVAIASVAIHRIYAQILGVSAPAGLVLGVAASLATVWALRSVAIPARTTTSYAVGWVAGFSVLLLGRPEGDYVIAGDILGYTLMAVGLAVGLVGVHSGRVIKDSKSEASPA